MLRIPLLISLPHESMSTVVGINPVFIADIPTLFEEVLAEDPMAFPLASRFPRVLSGTIFSPNTVGLLDGHEKWLLRNDENWRIDIATDPMERQHLDGSLRRTELQQIRDALDKERETLQFLNIIGYMGE